MALLSVLRYIFVKTVFTPQVAKRRRDVYKRQEVHTLIGAGAAEGAVDAANILKPALATVSYTHLSMTLLKNEENILPLKSGQKVAVIGELAKSPRFQGAGSVSYTHLDVYKRQPVPYPGNRNGIC